MKFIVWKIVEQVLIMDDLMHEIMGEFRLGQKPILLTI
jgi:hypothetical protein